METESVAFVFRSSCYSPESYTGEKEINDDFTNIPNETTKTSEGTWLVLSKASHKMGVIGRREPKFNRGS